MFNAEEFFTSADFSKETDFKDRLRAQLFGDIDQEFSSGESRAEEKSFYKSADADQSGNESGKQFDKQSAKQLGKQPGKRGSVSRRILDFDELEMVTAAGNGGRAASHPDEKEKLAKTINSLNKEILQSARLPFPGIGNNVDEDTD